MPGNFSDLNLEMSFVRDAKEVRFDHLIFHLIGPKADPIYKLQCP